MQVRLRKSLQSLTKKSLAASADGVGTKTILAADYNLYHGIGIDLVAMCVNDLVCQGSRPLVFSDYMSFNNVEEKVFHELINSIQKGCKEAGCELIGGETAESPGLYNKNYFDVAGFAVGKVKYTLPKSDMKPGDLILGLPSSGVHSNGFSLIRMILRDNDIDPTKETLPDGTTLIESLMTPTTIYVKTILELAKSNLIQGCAHITGGGMNNIRRILPDDMDFDLEPWDFPPIFKWIMDKARIDKPEMLVVFNCGYGMILVVKEKKLEKCQAKLRKLGTKADKIGQVVSKT